MRHDYIAAVTYVRHGIVLISSVGLGTPETAPTHRAMTTSQLITDMQSLIRHYDTV